nr:Ig-like domain-containing protein [Candidatus Gracilibacteria bacterium]
PVDQSYFASHPIIWTVSDEELGEISNGGMLKAYKNGFITITASFEMNNQTYSINKNIKINPPFTINGVYGDQTLTMFTGQSNIFTANKSVNWSVSSDSSQGGNAPSQIGETYNFQAGTKEGVANITVSDGSYSLILKINIVKTNFKSLEITAPSSLKMGENIAIGLKLVTINNQEFNYDGTNAIAGVLDNTTMRFTSLTPDYLAKVGDNSSVFQALKAGIAQVMVEIGNAGGNLVAYATITITNSEYSLNGCVRDCKFQVFPGNSLEFKFPKDKVSANLAVQAQGGELIENAQDNLDIFKYQAPDSLQNLKKLNETIKFNFDNQELEAQIQVSYAPLVAVKIKSADMPDLIFQKNMRDSSADGAIIKEFKPSIDIPNGLVQGDIFSLIINGSAITTSPLVGNNEESLNEDLMQKLQIKYDQVKSTPIYSTLFQSIAWSIDSNYSNLILKSTDNFNAYLVIIRNTSIEVAQSQSLPLKLVGFLSDGTTAEYQAGGFAHPIFGNPTWNFNNESIASISPSGLITANSVGTGTVSVVIGSQTTDSENNDLLSVETTAYANIKVVPAFTINDLAKEEDLIFTSIVPSAFTGIKP